MCTGACVCVCMCMHAVCPKCCFVALKKLWCFLLLPGGQMVFFEVRSGSFFIFSFLRCYCSVFTLLGGKCCPFVTALHFTGLFIALTYLSLDGLSLKIHSSFPVLEHSSPDCSWSLDHFIRVLSQTWRYFYWVCSQSQARHTGHFSLRQEENWPTL